MRTTVVSRPMASPAEVGPGEMVAGEASLAALVPATVDEEACGTEAERGRWCWGPTEARESGCSEEVGRCVTK